jgi:hypothetical protein
MQHHFIRHTSNGREGRVFNEFFDWLSESTK